MATRPWITPQEIRDYTDYPKVIDRSDAKLQSDIIRAENYVINRTNNNFEDSTKYPTIPPDIKLATTLVAEYYANVATKDPQKDYKSETFKDYSYTITEPIKSVDDVDITALISAHILNDTSGKINMKMRKL